MREKMPINKRLFNSVLICIVAMFLITAEALKVSAQLTKDGRWFKYNGQYKYLVGWDNQQLAADTSIDYTAVLDTYVSNGINKVRIWAYCWFGFPPVYLHPWTYSGGKFNLDSWSATNWERVRNVIAAARARNVVIEVSIFGPNDLCVSPGWDTWMEAFNENKNTNGVFTANSSGHFSPEFFDLNHAETSSSGKTLRDYQQAFVDKCIAEFGSYDNVYFEVCNEFPVQNADINSVYPWQQNWASRLRSNSSRLVSVHAHQYTADNTNGIQYFWNQSYVDIMNFHFISREPNTISSLLHSAQLKGKILQCNEGGNPYASDYGGDMDAATRHAWGFFMSGGYDAFYEDDPRRIGGSTFITASLRLKVLRDIAETLEFWKMSPVDGSGNEYDSLVSNGPGSGWQVMASPGDRYIVYFWGTQSQTSANIDLSAGTYTAVWYDARDGDVLSTITGISGGNDRNISAPATSGWSGGSGIVLTVVASATDTTPPSAPGTVRDGAAAGTDISSTTSRTQLSANWIVSTDAESGISNYQYAIGTTAGGTQTLNWVTLGNVTTVTKTGLSLTIGTTYYFSVKAINGAGLTGTATNSNGQVVTSASTPYYEAENAVVSGAVVAPGDAGCSGGLLVDYQNATGDYIEWTVNVGLAGMYKLEFRYANGGTGDRPLELKVNGSVVNSSLSFPVTGSWTTWSTVSNNVTLNAGNNTVRLTAIGSSGGNIDYLNVTATADTTAPSAPGTVRDGTGATDISSTTSRTQLSANWTASTDVESGISAYQYAIGTTAGGTSITNWTALGNVLTVTKTGLSLSIGTTYYFSVKGVNGKGLVGNATNSNGQVVISTAVADTTPPSVPGTVRDGATAGTDDSFTYSTTALSANWTVASDPESSISRYEYAIGTSAGATNITNWTAMGNVLTVTKTGLTLTVGTTYYFSVKAVNGQGLTGNAANSNGQYVTAINTTDTTPPISIPEVRDGTGASDDAHTYITTELSANWDNSADSESGISRYYFAIGSSPGATNITGWADNGELTSVTQTGLSLVIGTTYYFSVKAENGVALQSTPANSDGVCIISGALPPVISNVQSINITANSATISWTTDKQATSQAEYGLTVIYGNSTTEDSSFVTVHSVTITGLISGSIYHYRVISKDSDGRMGTSVDFTFTTLSPPAEVTDIRAYPNPCDFSNGKVIKFVVGAAGSETGEVRIYTLSGKLVRKILGTTEINWDGKNEDNEKVSRGVYIYRITPYGTNGDTVTGKLAVTR